MAFKRKTARSTQVKNINLAVCTIAGIILDIRIPADVENALAKGERIPSHFVGPLKITNYMLAPSYESELRAEYGNIRSRDMVNKLKAYLEGKKGANVIAARAPATHHLKLD